MRCHARAGDSRAKGAADSPERATAAPGNTSSASGCETGAPAAAAPAPAGAAGASESGSTPASGVAGGTVGILGSGWSADARLVARTFDSPDADAKRVADVAMVPPRRCLPTGRGQRGYEEKHAEIGNGCVSVFPPDDPIRFCLVEFGMVAFGSIRIDSVSV